ncbi:MAG: PIG-L family deacetylase [Planctomycetota bacterium]|nr:PIG-L family deacetylase [Planctomycetota bacterium]
MKKLAKRIITRAWRAVVPKTARNSLRLWLTLEMPDRAPTLIDRFAEHSVVVLAPHMDDEIIGPGGTIIRHVKASSQVMVVFMTDGRSGDPELLAPGLSSEELDRRKAQLAKVRKAESAQAAKIVGVKELKFLDGPDGHLSDTPQIVAALAQILSDRKATMIYLPALTDNHRDHWATNRIFRCAIDRLDSSITQNLIIRGYEVWTPLPANTMADITESASLKKQAIGCFITQLKDVDYTWTALGLNQYRSMMHLHGKGYAEAFLETSVDEYCELFERISLAHPANTASSVSIN